MSEPKKNTRKKSRSLPDPTEQETQEQAGGVADDAEIRAQKQSPESGQKDDVEPGVSSSPESPSSKPGSGDHDSEPQEDAKGDEKEESAMKAGLKPRVEGPPLARCRPNLEFCEEILGDRDVLDIVHQAVREVVHACRKDFQRIAMIKRIFGEDGDEYAVIWFEVPRAVIKRICRQNNNFAPIKNITPDQIQQRVRSKS
jgi:hypothetical protein